MLTSKELPSSDLLMERSDRLHGCFTSQGLKLVIMNTAAGSSDGAWQAINLQRFDLKVETSQDGRTTHPGMIFLIHEKSELWQGQASSMPENFTAAGGNCICDASRIL